MNTLLAQDTYNHGKFTDARMLKHNITRKTKRWRMEGRFVHGMEGRFVHASESKSYDQHNNKSSMACRLVGKPVCMYIRWISFLCEVFLHCPRSIKVKIPFHVHSKCNPFLYVNSHSINFHSRELLIVHSEKFSNCLHHDTNS